MMMMPADVVTAHDGVLGLSEEVEVVEHLHRIGVPAVARRRTGRPRRGGGRGAGGVDGGTASHKCD